MTLLTPFDRDGHLTDLGLELIAAEEVDAATLLTARSHLDTCTDCAGRMGALRADGALAPPPRVQQAANRPSRWWAAGVLAAVAVLAVGIGLRGGQTTSPADPFRAKGPQLALEVWVDAAPTSRQVRSGDSVHGGDRLGFRIRSGVEGHVLVTGVDHTGATYLCAPSSGKSVAVRPTDAAQPIAGAIRLDDTPGEERIVAVRCDDPFGFDDLADALSSSATATPSGAPLPALRAGCVQQEVVLSKESP